MRKAFYAALCFAAAAGALAGWFIVRAVSLRMELDAQLDARGRIEEFAVRAPLADAWNNPAAAASSAGGAGTDVESEEVYGAYTAPEGFVLVSYSAAWDDALMKSLYDELVSNVHGDEIYYLEKVVVHAGGEREDVLGMQQERETRCAVSLSHPALLPPGLTLDLASKATTIHLYDGDSRATVASMAATLSHEYGHHFTNFYFFDTGDPGGWLSSDYAVLRGLSPSRVYAQITDYADYLVNHKWYVQEIAAEDYVVLMGSPATRQTFVFYDVYDWLLASVRGEELADYSGQSALAFNVSPHENLSLAFPARVEGLAAFFRGFAGADPPDWPDRDEEIVITVTPRTHSYDLVRGYTTFRSFEIAWNCPYQTGQPVYTLVCYDENDDLAVPVKTVEAGQTGRAYVGNVVYEMSRYVYDLDDGLARGVKRFRVTVVFDDGSVFVSDPVEYHFGG